MILCELVILFFWQLFISSRTILEFRRRRLMSLLLKMWASVSIICICMRCGLNSSFSRVLLGRDPAGLRYPGIPRDEIWNVIKDGIEIPRDKHSTVLHGTGCNNDFVRYTASIAVFGMMLHDITSTAVVLIIREHDRMPHGIVELLYSFIVASVFHIVWTACRTGGCISVVYDRTESLNTTAVFSF